MRLRIARKMDQRPPHAYPNRRRDKRVWWMVYSADQLARSEQRLGESWRGACPPLADGTRNLTPDFFAMNRVSSRRIRQATIRKMDKARR